MADYPYTIARRISLGAGATGTISFSASRNESYEIRDIRVLSTGFFQVNGIRKSTGEFFTDASPSNPLEGGMFQSASSAALGIQNWPVPLVVGGGETLNIDVQDTSGAANVVRIAMTAIRKV